MNIVENHTEDNLTIVKGQIIEGVYPNYPMETILLMQNLIKKENIFIW